LKNSGWKFTSNLIVVRNFTWTYYTTLTCE
jgi:hypothetical protein